MAQLTYEGPKRRNVLIETYTEPNEIDDYGNKFWYDSEGKVIKVDYTDLIRGVLFQASRTASRALRNGGASWVVVNPTIAQQLKKEKKRRKQNGTH